MAFVLRLGAVQVRAADPERDPGRRAPRSRGSRLARRPLRRRCRGLRRRDRRAGRDRRRRDVRARTGHRAPRIPAVFDLATGVPLPPDETPRRPSPRSTGRSRSSGKGLVHELRGASSASLGSALNAAARLKDVLATELLPLDDKNAGLRLTVGGQDVTSSLRHTLLYDPASLSHLPLLSRRASVSGELRVELNDSTGLQARPAGPHGGEAGRQGLRNEWDSTARLARLTRAPARPPAPAPAQLRRRQRARQSFGGDGSRAAHRSPRSSFATSRRRPRRTRKSSTFMAEARMEMHFRPQRDRSGLRRGHREPLLSRTGRAASGRRRASS